MSHKKAEDAEEKVKADPNQAFNDASDAVCAVAKKFCDAGMGGQEAWKTALELWRDTHGTQPAKG